MLVDKVQPQFQQAGLVVRHNATYLVAMINEYDDMRHLTLDRLDQVSLLCCSRQKYRMTIKPYGG